MFVIDTNIHAAYLLQHYENDELTKKYLSFYTSIPLSQRIVPEFILNEFEIFILQVAPYKYRLTPDQREQFQMAVIEYIHDISHSFTLALPSLSAYKQAIDIYQMHSKKRFISFTDSLLISLAHDQGFTILTKDNRLQEIAKELNVTFYTP